MARPNILLIFTDQQRADTIHAAGNPVIRTPHLDRIAQEGVLFRSAYTPSPVCVSARCSLIHGQYPHNTGCFDNGYRMPEDRPTFMGQLTDAGYRTHGIGKMHFNPDSRGLKGFQTREYQEEMRGRVDQDDYLTFLQAHGFEHVYDPMGQRGEMYYIPQPAQMPAKYHATNWVGDRAVEFLQNQPSDQPFLLFASFIHPHPPFSAPTPWNKLYRGALMPLPKTPPGYEALHTYANRHQNRYKYRDDGIDNNLLRVMKAYYYACISFIDYQIGRLLTTLEETGQLDNTLILHTSDHGELLGDYHCFGKRCMLDSACRIPMLVRYPERFAAGQVCDVPTSLVDVMPTFLAATGISTDDLTLDGVDLAALTQNGSNGSHADRMVHSEYQKGARGVYMACNREWKYFYSAPDREEFLFDRITDPEETRSRAGLSLCGNTLNEMHRHLMGYYREEGFTEVLDGDGWKTYPQPEVPRNPDAGLLIQDAGWARPYQTIPGYTD